MAVVAVKARIGMAANSAASSKTPVAAHLAATASVHVVEPAASAPCRSVWVPMDDGVGLRADLWGQFGEPAPVILERTPYGRRRTDQAERAADANRPDGRDAIAARANADGFLYLVQECRGTGESGGRFSKYLREADDTAATLAWVRAQPWCDGWIGMTGFSYSAACQMAGLGRAAGDPDAAVVDCGGFFDALSSGIRQGGALELKQATWAHAQALRDALAADDAEAAKALRAEDVMDWLRRGPWGPGLSPLAAAPDHERNVADIWRHGTDGPFWDRPGLRADPPALRATRTRTLFVTSWHDTSLRGTLDNVAAMTAPGATCPAPHLVIGPWSHGDRWSRVSGEVDFGEDALPERGLGASLPDMRAAFLRAARDGRPFEAPPVRWFEMGGGTGARLPSGAIDHGGRWRDAPRWPPERAETLVLHLSDAGLVFDAGGTMERAFLSDPDDPVPTLGGAINSGAPVMEGGMWDQAPLDGRVDILCFETVPLERPLTLCGPVVANLQARSDAPDFDLAVKLVDVYPDGSALNLSDGILRARHRNGPAAEDFAPMGETVAMAVTANPVGARILAGHRLRLDVAASNFPCFDVNPQTGAPQGVPGPRRRATITVSSAPEAPSTLALTVLAEGRA